MITRPGSSLSDRFRLVRESRSKVGLGDTIREPHDSFSPFLSDSSNAAPIRDQSLPVLTTSKSPTRFQFPEPRFSPVSVGSTIFDYSVHPCKVVPSIHPPCHVPYVDTERKHNGRFGLLPITPEIQWDPTREGRISQGLRPVEGGYESNGAKLLFRRSERAWEDR